MTWHWWLVLHYMVGLAIAERVRREKGEGVEVFWGNENNWLLAAVWPVPVYLALLASC